MRSFLIVLVMMLIVPIAGAQEFDIANPNALPSTVLLEGFSWVHQGTNRCSAAALTIHLSYYQDVSLDTYFELARRDLNTYGADASVRIEEMAAVAEARGLKAIVRRGGTVDLMRQLVAAGFPVLVENVYYDGDDLYRDWLSHNRVLMGYNDAAQLFYFEDPLLGYPDGKTIQYSYTDFEARWKAFNRDYMVFYTDDQEAVLREALGAQWDEGYNARWTMEMAQAEIARGDDNLNYSYFNLGWAQLELGMAEEAAASFDAARDLRLPMRMLWYEFSPFEAYIAVGRYQDVIDLVHINLNVAGDTISIEEWYYYAGLAYEGLGNRDRALINYQVALARNANFAEAAERMRALQG